MQPGEYNWTQRTDALEDGLVDRMTRKPVFFLGAAPDSYEAMSDAFIESSTLDLKEFVPDQERNALAEISLETGEPPRLVMADSGRGASGLGIAVEIAEALALYGGATATMVEAARAVRWVYRKLSTTRGHRVMVSLGAAEHLAAADWVNRFGDGDFDLVGSGDMSSNSHDRAFTGGDAFYVVFGAEERLHHYQVSAYGEVDYIGSSPRIRPWTDEPPEWEAE